MIYKKCNFLSVIFVTILCCIGFSVSCKHLSAFQEAQRDYIKGNYTKAFNKTAVLANQRNDTAQFYLSLMYKYGKGVQKDSALAQRWLEKAAKNGNEDALFYCGSLENDSMLYYYIMATKYNDPQAQYYVGKTYDYINGFIHGGYNPSIKWYKMSGENGLVVAQYHYGKELLSDAELHSGNDSNNKMAFTLSADKIASMYSDGINWITKAANQGDTIAQNDLGTSI